MTIKKFFYSSIQKIIEGSGRLSKKGIPILMFHQISHSPTNYIHDNSISIKKDKFISFISAMKERGYTFIPIYTIRDNIDKKVAVITFDDAFSSIVKNAIPYLEENSIPYTVFVCEDYIDRGDYLTSEQLYSLAKSSLCTIGYHSKSHLMMRKLSVEQLREEMDPSKLENRINKEVEVYAYPFGSLYSCGFKKPQLARERYRYAFSTVSVRCTDSRFRKGRYFLPRINVNELNREKLLSRL